MQRPFADISSAYAPIRRIWLLASICLGQNVAHNVLSVLAARIIWVKFSELVKINGRR
jgi:hypothetical protein